MKMKNIRSIFITLVSTLCLNGCDLGPGERAPVHESGFFQYIYLRENGKKHRNIEENEIVIVGFTELGKKEMSIDVPFEINGDPVTMFGIEDQSFSYNHNWDVIISENLQRLYIHENIKFISCDGGNATLMVCAESKMYNYYSFSFKETYCPTTWFEGKTETNEKNLYIANTVFFLNSPSTEKTDSIYRIENYTTNVAINRPVDPSICGYIFKGWYTEKECINSWDFNTLINFEESQKINLYAGWQQI